MRRVALLVGNSTFAPDSTISDLRFPPADVSAMSSLLGDPEIGRYDRVISLIEKRSDEILITLNQMLDEERDASILFYYSGHGKPSDDGRLYLAASNTTQRLLPATGVPFASILQMKEAYGLSRFAIILDCCFAGLGSTDIKGSEDDQLKAYVEGRGVFFLGAANATTTAKEDTRLGHGVLTGAIVSGLESGSADVDGDGRVTGPNLFAWCRNFAEKRGDHRPVQVNRVIDDDLVIAFSIRRLSPETIERVRTKLQLAWEHRLLPPDDIDQLRRHFLEPSVVSLPSPKSLESYFLAYAEGKMDWEQFRQSADHADVPKLLPEPFRTERVPSATKQSAFNQRFIRIAIITTWIALTLVMWLPIGLLFETVLNLRFVFHNNVPKGNSGAFLALVFSIGSGVVILRRLCHNTLEKAIVYTILVGATWGALFVLFIGIK